MTLSTPCAARLRISLGAIVANWQALAQRLAPQSCAAVVKANAYGLGAAQVAPALYAAGCREFFVALVQEGLALRPLLPADATIYVLHGALPGAEADCAHHGLTPVLGTLGQLQRMQALAQRLDHELPVALQIDTGMARLGLQPAEVQQLAAQPQAFAGLRLTLVISHLVSAEEPEDPISEQQRQRFIALTQTLRAAHPQALQHTRLSLANSSGIFRGRDFHFDLARPGAALYGVTPIAGQAHPLQPVLSLQARLLQWREVNAGEGVGYNHLWRAERPTRIATLSIGYADGLLRSCSNRATLRLLGQELPLVGRVSMDMITVDVSSLPLDALQEGAFFDVLDAGHDINALAREAGTNAYEILTQLGARYERVYERAHEPVNEAA